MVQWRKRKRGTPRQVGKAFPIEESSQKKKGALSKLRERFAGKTHGRQEREYVEKLRELIREHTKSGEERLADGIVTPEDAEYLEKRGWVKIDPYTEQLVMTAEGQVVLLGEKLKQKKRLIKSLTEKEKEWLMEKRELEGTENT